MRARSIRLLASACLLAGLTGPGRGAEPARAGFPSSMPAGSGATFTPPAPPVVGGEFPCPPDPCPPIACPPVACPPACAVPARQAPRVRVIMSPPEIVFQQSGCADHKGLRKYLPGCSTCKPEYVTEGAPQGVPCGPKPQGTPQGVTGQPQGQAQAFQTVPVTTFHAVPVTTFQTVPVTTFQTVPVTGAAAFGVQGVGIQGVGAQAFGVPGFGAQAFGAQAFGVPGFGAQAFGGGFPSPMAFGASGSSGAEFEARLLHALAAIAAQGKSQGASPCGVNGAGKAGANAQGAQGADSEDVVRQFLELERRLGLLTTQVKDNTKNIGKLLDDAENHETRLLDIERRLDKLDGGKKMTPPAVPPIPPGVGANPPVGPVPRGASK